MHKKCVIKTKPKFENYKDCLEATKLDGKKNYLKKMESTQIVLKKIIKEFIKKNIKLILKTQKRFKSERQNVFTEEINKIASCSNDDKKMQSTDSIETFAYGASIWKDLVRKKEETKCNNILK